MPQHTMPQITWQPMTTPKQTWWHAAYRSAVSGTIRGLAAVVVSVPDRSRRTA
jgi:hypothetical protein